MSSKVSEGNFGTIEEQLPKNLSADDWSTVGWLFPHFGRTVSADCWPTVGKS